MDNLNFTEEEIKEQLSNLGYKNVPKHKVLQFKRDLDALIDAGNWENLVMNQTVARSDPSPPPYTKEKVIYADDFSEGFYLQSAKSDYNRKLHSHEDRNSDWHQEGCDSYAQHSVAQRLKLPTSNPGKQQVEADLTDSQSDSISPSSPDPYKKYLMKRKVLRKHKGKSLVCDESVYSEDSGKRVATMYDSQWDEESEKNSLTSSFWSDDERQDDCEDEEVQLEDGFNSEAAGASEMFPPESPEEVHRENFTRERRDGQHASRCTSESPAPSLLTSGYGTYKAEERGEQMSESEIRGEEDDWPSFCSEPPHDEACSGDDHVKAAEEEIVDNETVPSHESEDKVEFSEDAEQKTEADGRLSNKNIDSSWTTYNKMCEEWEENLRQMRETASLLEERLAGLCLSTSAKELDEEMTDESETQSSETDSSLLTTLDSYLTDAVEHFHEEAVRPKHKAFIRPTLGQSAVKKTDPVSKYFQYKQLWDMFKLPGEKSRKSLRWEIKQRLAYQAPPPKPRKVYVPNTYTVPTEKKRLALRWEVRNDLARGLIPQKFHF